MVRCASVLVCLATTTLLLSPASADAQYFGRNKVQNARLEFRTLRTEHFDIYYYPEEERVTRQAARMAERWYARYSELLDDTFTQRQVIVLYASHPDFTQTNVSAGAVSEGTGGFTERLKSRIVLPFSPGLGETDHVIGHELVHAFQIDIGKRTHQNAFGLPLWFIEGMAEYLSLGPSNAFTDMWLRDAKLHHRLPTVEQLDNPRYFPYRYGHAFWSCTRTAIRRRDRRPTPALENARRRRPAGRGDRLDARRADARLAQIDPDGRRRSRRDRHAACDCDIRRRRPRARRPAISPDGRQIMFISERDRLSLDLFMADASSGAIIRKVISTAADPHFDSLQYIQSAGAWDATGHRFVVAAVIDGAPSLAIVDTTGTSPRRDIRLRDLGEIFNPSWSPDGKHIVFSAMKGGLSDLFVYTIADGTLAQLTDDEFADLHPAWSPDGKTIAFASGSVHDVARRSPLRAGSHRAARRGDEDRAPADGHDQWRQANQSAVVA